MRKVRTLATLFCASLITATCLSQEPSRDATIEELRREVAELRKLVAELTKKIDSIEYHNLPRLDTSPQPQRPIPTKFGDAKHPFPLDIERGSAAPPHQLRRHNPLLPHLPRLP